MICFDNFFIPPNHPVEWKYISLPGEKNLYMENGIAGYIVSGISAIAGKTDQGE